MSNRQIGTVHGQVANTINNHAHTHNHQHHHSHQHDHVHNIRASGPVFVHKTVVIQDPTFSLQATPAPPARQGRRTKTPARDITPGQRDVLALMRPLAKPVRVDVLIWMRIEFGTSLVMDLDSRELYRLQNHLVEVRRAAGVLGG